jgi:hypothetical protein
MPHGHSPGTLAHEAMHVVNRMLDMLSFEHKDDESANYLLTFLVDQFNDFMRHEKEKKIKAIKKS